VSTNLEEFFSSQGLKPVGSLSHWGIKGMKWGIRRSDAELARLRGGQTESEDAARARRTQAAINKARTTATASDADLNQLINRIQLEKRYVEAKSSASILKKGNSAIRTVLNAGDTANTAIKFLRSPSGRLLATKLNFTKLTEIADRGQNLTDLAEQARPQNQKKDK